MKAPQTNRSATARQWRTYLIVTVVVAFGANLIWEMAHMRAYRELESQPWRETLAGCAAAALGDVVLTWIPFALGAVVSRSLRWTWAGGAKTYCALAALGFATAVIGEHVALRSGEWSYNERMPIIPGIEVGAWPVLQLTLLVPLSFGLANAVRISRQKRAPP